MYSASSPSLQVADVQPYSTSTSSSTLDFLHDQRLVIIFHDLLRFTSLLNAPSSNPTRYTPVLRDTDYQNIICSIQYRLLRLQDKLSFILDESARLAMLAFLTTTFQVAGKRATYPHLERRFREFCRAAIAQAPPEVALWLLVVGALSVLQVDGGGEDAEWMAKSWRAHILADWGWDEALGRLRAFPWIGVLHDEAGRAAFEELRGR